MESVVLLDAAGRRRSAATLPGHRRGLPPRNKGMRYPADPPTVEEIVLVMRHAGDRPHGHAVARADRGDVASRALDQRDARADRERPRQDAARAEHARLRTEERSPIESCERSSCLTAKAGRSRCPALKAKRLIERTALLAVTRGQVDT